MLQFIELIREVWEILLSSGFEIRRMRKQHNPTADLRYRSCPRVPRNILKVVWLKQCFSKKTKHYPDRKMSQILGIFATNWEDIFCFWQSRNKNFFRWTLIIFPAPNKKCHKILSYLRFRPSYKVRFRSMHKLTYRHLNENVTVFVI